MKISKKQQEFIDWIEKCGGVFRDEIPEFKYPKSVIDSLINKGLVVEFKNKITSATA